MILLQLSSAHGPTECCLAVSLGIKRLVKEADKENVTLTLLEQENGSYADTVKSALFKLQGNASLALAKKWNGTLQWICQSPYRTKHKRKNWFFMGSFTQHDQSIKEMNISIDEIKFEMCRSSGPGGQHVNKTSSAVRATHLISGISVKVQSERSQHANKRLAKVLIDRKLLEKSQQKQEAEKSSRHKSHHAIERGNAIRIFKGISFLEVN